MFTTLNTEILTYRTNKMVVYGNSDGTLRFKKNKNHQELKNEIVKKES